nr:hypothetical protein [Methylobacterium sp. 37f]
MIQPTPIRLITVLTLSLGLAGVALAQGAGAPAGMDAATAPGGTEGRAGPRNEAEAFRSGDAIPVPPRAGGIAAESMPAESMPAESMPARGANVPPARP